MPTQAIRTKRAISNGGKVRLITTNADYAKLCKRSLQRLPMGDRSRVELESFASFSAVAASKKSATRTVFISRLADLPEEGVKLGGQPQSKHVLFLEGLPVEAMASRLTQLDIRTPERLHLAAERSSDRVADLVYRLLSGITHRDGPEPIVDAWIEGDGLVLLSASFDRLTVPLDKLSRNILSRNIGTERSEVESFEIDEDGRFLFWPHADAHFGWDQFRQIVDPASALAAKQRSRAFNVRYGAAIRALREKAGLKQSDIEGVSERHLRRIELGEQAASKAVLQALADTLGVSLEDCLKQLASAMTK